MTTGLRLENKKSYRRIAIWATALLAVTLLFAAGWFTYQWYTTGDEPPLVPLPASALTDPTIDETPVAKKDIDAYTVPATHPRYITIPALGIDKARVKTVGLTENNMLDIPKNIYDTAWYDKSAYPGQGDGTVVIDGHNGGYANNGIFANLASLKNGDTITIERGDGEKIVYTVVENKTESLKEANATGMTRLMTPYDPNKEGLGLITCGGNWIPRDKVFDKRVLVRAVAT